MRPTVAGILLAGGYGSNGNGRSKLLWQITGEATVIGEVWGLMDYCLDVFPTYLVVNTKYGPEIVQTIKPGSSDCVVLLEQRVGTAGAVARCLPQLLCDQEKQHVLVLYGDMPLWRPETVARLIDSHLACRERPVISMFSLPLADNTPESVTRYGRIIRDESGRVIAICEPGEATSHDLSQARTVNPSAWVFDIKWLTDNIPRLPPHDKNDGHPVEYWLPDLVPLAVNQGVHINELELSDPSEALGVNDDADLALVRTEFFQRSQRGW